MHLLHPSTEMNGTIFVCKPANNFLMPMPEKINANVYFTGEPEPLGATWTGEGVNFALYAENAEGVELCLFNSIEDDIESLKIRIKERSHNVWHTYIPGLRPGQLYAYRVYGKYDPESGHRFNSNKLLLDPYAKAIAGTILWDDALFGYEVNNPDSDLSFNRKDSAPFLPKCVVIKEDFDWENDEPLNIPFHESIIYEAHIKGLTYLHPEIPDDIKGTYAAIAHPAIINHLKKLGITAIELMPVHHFVSDRHLQEKGLSNYWGYNSIAFFAPDVRYSSSGIQGGQVNEFKAMVKTLHAAGIEVILDVVYNHTAEGNELGPTLSFRGIDNEAYYRLTRNKRYYMDYTGTGNTLNAIMPNVLKLIMDSLRYWILEMHVDGFRFDLAATLARGLHEVDRLVSFLSIIYQDPVISKVKLIAEPWDIGEDGYQVGNFPAGWVEWNGMYRDCMRDFWRGADDKLAEFAERFTGSSDLYRNNFRTPSASINFITAHDGFTLHDLVTYNEKHNEANKDNCTDGECNNRSWNCGEEGETEDEAINKLRARQKRNFLTTLLLSQGVPMILSGDEMSNTQYGNNNAYCQDNEISWIDWSKTDNDFFEFTCKLIKFRKSHPAFCRKKWFQGRPIRGLGVEDIAWFTPAGTEMTEENWQQDFAKTIGIFLNGLGLRCLGANGEKLTDDNFYIMFNAYHEPVEFNIPAEKFGCFWIKIIDTYKGIVCDKGKTHKPCENITVQGNSIIMLQCAKTGIDTRTPLSLPELTYPAN
jgi:isoamylase